MKYFQFRKSLLSVMLGLCITFAVHTTANAIGSQQNPQSGSTGLQATVTSPPPTTPASIGLPVNGQTLTASPTTVSGFCTSGLLVKVFSNNIFVGSTQCINGSFTLRVDLFSGENDLIARVFDALDQTGPDGSIVKVTFQDAQFTQSQTKVSLTSNFAKLGADPGQVLTWPLILSGGLAPYAVSVDWGDGSGALPQTVSFAGTFNITHVYQNAGVYTVIVRATDTNGTTAFLQLVGVANGKVTQGTAGTGTGSSNGGTNGTSGSTQKSKFVWWPFAAIFPGIGATFWLGRKAELVSLHRQLDRQ